MDVVHIVEDGDLTIEVTQTSDDAPPKTGHFSVNEAVLMEASQVFLKMLVGADWKERLSGTVSLKGHLTVTEVWLRVVHETKLVYSLLFPEIWQLVQAIDQYDLDVTLFSAWFASWFAQNSHELLKPAELLYPTWRFDHAKGFAKCTRDLAYKHTGHITEERPTKIHQYHLPARLMRKSAHLISTFCHADIHLEQLNAAKGRLRTVLFRGLWVPCENLLKARCTCKEKSLFGYQHHLYIIQVWPLETVFLRKSIDQILANLARFSFEAPAKACVTCRQNYKGIVAEVASSVRNYFDGLCLDCLDSSKPKKGDVAMDYWRHDKLKEWEIVKGCRFIHRQPTWYFSFNGRREDRDRMVKQRKSQQEARRAAGHFSTGSEGESS
ncbi:MAG: hypothetical protein LQ348_001981 [Seirophora lacunosa]|nr:MAG: hypothetical protein LQ348_001981 [Seirophora lacunosa]